MQRTMLSVTVGVPRCCGGISAFSSPSVRPYNFANRDLNDGSVVSRVVCISALRHDLERL